MKADHLIFALCPVLLCPWFASLSHAVQFTAINGSLCVNSAFTTTIWEQNDTLFCAALCSDKQTCQAFTTADGPCQLFVFDKCSKSVRNCSCSRRGQVFVRQQSGLQPGALCPSGYSAALCGIKYRLYTPTATWKQQLYNCRSESGLVIMSDITDAAEYNQIKSLNTLYSWNTFYVGGFQAPGSSEPSGGWYWAECNNTAFSASYWNSGEPNDNPHDENAACMYNAGLGDITENNLQKALCKCTSPFD